MIRVAYLIDTISCDTAGTQKQLIQIIKRLDRKTFSPHLICLWETAWMKKNELPCDCTVLQYNGFLKADFPGVIRRLCDLISRYRFHIIQTFFDDSIFVGYLGGMLSCPRPILLSSRRDMGLGDGNQPLYHRVYKLVLPFINNSFSGIVTNSDNLKHYVSKREKTTPSKIKVIYNGIDIPVHSGNIPDLFQKNKCNLWIGIVASLTPVKRHDIFLKAFATLKGSKSNPFVKAVVLGDGPERAALFEMTDQLNLKNDVIFAGQVSNVYDYLKYLHIGVLCSDREGLSNSIMEYMACSLPVIATSVGGNVELVDESNGICVPPGDVEALAAAMRKLVESHSLRKSLGKGSFIKLKKKYSWSKTMTALETYYRGLVCSKLKRDGNDQTIDSIY